MATRAGTGLSENGDAADAGREATRLALENAGIDRADFVLVFATMPHRPRFAALLDEVQRIAGTSVLCGCSGAGVIAGGIEVEGGPAVAVLAVRSDRLRATAVVEPAGEDQGRAAAEALGRAPNPPALFVTFTDPAAVRPESLLEGLQASAPGAPAVGAAASGTQGPGGTFQFCGRNVATRSIAALRIEGPLRRAVGVTQGCLPVGPPSRVTKAQENVVLELDGRPALEVLRSRLPAALAESLGRLGGHLFVGLPPDRSQTTIDDGEYLVRPLFAVDPARGALLLGEEVHEGQPLAFVLRDGGAARDDLKSMLGRLAGEAPPSDWSFGLYFNCAGRGTGLYGFPGVDSAFIAGQFPRLPVAGLFGNAEIAPLRGANRLFTFTGVLALVGENAAEAAPA
ncbi:MAG TPA: FIST N-terminal domain-containing protein [Candidatus Polarisedimenticolia bacterium]|nr:FIST N-terminal domain-containing protein [Candidatus Polarisedimenticolia bacterium]